MNETIALQGAIRQAYVDRDDNGENVIRKTLTGTRLSRVGREVRAT
jgi:hypothetical protein